jgi:hypothetical protein
MEMSDEVIKKLEARIKELEEKVNPQPAAPPTPSKPYQRYDPTEQLSPPVRLTGREQYREDQTPEEALNDARKERNPVGQMMPLAQFLNKGQPLPELPPAQAVTVPISNKQPGIDAVDAIALSFARREREEEIAKALDVARRLRGG